MDHPNKMAVVRYHFSWRIQRKTNTPINGFVESKVFPTGVQKQWKWRLRLYPTGCEHTPEEVPAVVLRFVEGCSAHVTSAVLFCVEVTHDGARFCTMSSYIFHTPGAEAVFRGGQVRPFSGLNDEVYMSLEMMIEEEDTSVPYCNAIDDYLIMSSQIGRTYFGDEGKDLTLISSDRKTRRVHKVILMARSSYFYTLFSKYESRERLEVNIESRVLSEVLYYMYSGALMSKTSWNDEMARELYIAADYYLINGLKESCLKYFLVKLDRTTVVDLLVFADTYSNVKLKNACIKFIIAKVSRGSAEWVDFCERCGSYVQEVSQHEEQQVLPPI